MGWTLRRTTSRLPYGGLLGKNDRDCEKNLGFYVALAKHSPYSWSALYLNGGSDCHLECAALYQYPLTQTTPDPLSIDASRAKDRCSTSSRRFLRERSVHKTVERSPRSGKPMLDKLEMRLLTLFDIVHKVIWKHHSLSILHHFLSCCQKMLETHGSHMLRPC